MWTNKVRQLYPQAEYVFSRHNDFSSVREDFSFISGSFFFSFTYFYSLDSENVRRELSGTTNYKSSMVADEHCRLRLSGEKANFCRIG